MIWAINRTIVPLHYMACKMATELNCPHVSQVKSRQWLSRLVAKALRYHFNITVSTISMAANSREREQCSFY